MKVKKGKLAVFDADGFIFYVGYQFKDQLNLMGRAAAESRLDDMLSKTLDKIGATHYIGFFGKQGVKNFRHSWATLKTYKGHRKKEPWHEFFSEHLKNHFVKKWGFIPVGEIEADDAVVIAHEQFKDEWDIVHVGEDKDFRQVGKYKRWNPKKREYENMTHYGGRKFFWQQMIMGDSTDAIAGIEGQGKRSKLVIQIEELEKPTEEEMFEIVRNGYIQKYGDGYLYYMMESYLLLNMLKEPGFDYPDKVVPINHRKKKFSPDVLIDL